MAKLNTNHQINTNHHSQPNKHFVDKRLLALMLIAYVALLIGCTSIGSDKVNADYLTGTGTLQLSFDSQYPPSTIYSQDQSAIVITAKNSGGYTISSGRLIITTDDSVLYLGTKQQFLDGVRPSSSVALVRGSNYPLYGKSVMTPDGDSLPFSFNVYALPLPQGSQQRSATITASACFTYGTFQHASVCIDFDPYSTTTSSKIKQVCKSADVSMASGGGPVNVGTVQTRIDALGNGDIVPSFSFSISAPSDLKFFAIGDEQQFCNANPIPSAAHDTIYFAASLSDMSLDCSPLVLVPGYRNTFIVPLINNAAKITCTSTLPISNNGGYGGGNNGPIGNYLAPLTVNMTYGVVTTASRTVTVTSLIS